MESSRGKWRAIPRERLKRLDLTGILLFAGGIVLLLAFLLSLSTGEPRFAEGMFGLVLLLMFVWWELRVSSPFIDIRLLIAFSHLSETCTSPAKS